MVLKFGMNPPFKQKRLQLVFIFPSRFPAVAVGRRTFELATYRRCSAVRVLSPGPEPAELLGLSGPEAGVRTWILLPEGGRVLLT